MIRYSITTFLAAVAVAAMVIAALASPNHLSLRIMGTTTLAVTFAASIAAIAWQRTARWFWIGFALAGWSYLWLAFYAGPGTNPRNILFTDYLSLQLDLVMKSSSPIKTPAGELVTIRDGEIVRIRAPHKNLDLSLAEAEKQGYLKYAYTSITTPSKSHFNDISHYAWTLLFSCISGCFSLWLHRSSRAETIRHE